MILSGLEKASERSKYIQRQAKMILMDLEMSLSAYNRSIKELL
jgi:hypothetical protein